MADDDTSSAQRLGPIRGRLQGSSDQTYAEAADDAAGHAVETIRSAPISALRHWQMSRARREDSFAEGPEYRGSFGRTLFDERASEDGSVTVVFPADTIGDIPPKAWSASSACPTQP